MNCQHQELIRVWKGWWCDLCLEPIVGNYEFGERRKQQEQRLNVLRSMASKVIEIK